MTKEKFNKGEIVIYKPKGGEVELRVKMEKETVWLSLNQISTLFGRDKSVTSRHLKNIFRDKELDKNSTVAKIATVQKEGKREIIREIEYFDLNMILSIIWQIIQIQPFFRIE